MRPRCRRAARLDIDLFEPDRHPGAGPNYAPGPARVAADELRGAPDRHVVARQPRGPAQRAALVRPLAPRRRRPPPRIRRARRSARISPKGSSRCSDMPRGWSRSGFASCCRGGASQRRGVGCLGRWRPVGSYDEVLIATGHERHGTPTWTHAAALVPQVYPVERWLAPAAVPAGAHVAIRGFGLTFIDTALALTAGRGGSFHPSDHPYRLSYSRGADDAGLLVPFARSGLPMLPKPGPELALDHPELERVAARERELLASLAAPVSLVDDVLPVLARAARASLLAVGQVDCETRAMARRGGGRPPADPSGFGGGADRALAGDRGRPRAARHAVGDRPDLARALPGARGTSWRARAARRRLARVPPTRRRPRALAFGPSPDNAARLLALIDAGIVDLGRSQAGRSPSAAVAPSCARREATPRSTWWSTPSFPARASSAAGTRCSTA